MDVKPNIDMCNSSMVKGEVRDGKNLVAWDCIQDCRPDSCPIGSQCMYKASEKCGVQVQYLQALTDTLFTTYRYLSEEMLFKIGMHLVPLYSQLCRQKIVEKSVGSLCYEDAKGVTRIHPIYKEIRETMKVIVVMWKEMGFNGMPNGANPDVPTFMNNRDGFGDPTHYANLVKDADNKRNVIR